MPPIESVTPPSLRNLSLEEEANQPENEATSWEANVARNLETIPRASSPYPRKMSTLEDLEPDTDNDMIDVSDFFKRPSNDKRSPRPETNNYNSHDNSRTLPYTSNSPTYLPMNTTAAAAPAKPHRTKIWGDPPGQKKGTPWMASMFEKTATQGSI